MFWQYRPEVLGFESPAWGVTKLDGSAGSVGIAAKEFIEKLAPYTDEIMQAPAPKPQIAIWKGRKNEILSFCIQNSLTGFAKSVEAYTDAAYNNNYNCCIVDDDEIANGLDGIKLLILPYCYGADKRLITAVDKFVREGGTVLCEAHLGGYNADTGRHSYVMPGCGADRLWGIREEYTTSSYHLKSLAKADGPDMSALGEDLKKAIAVYGLNGGKNFKLHTTLGLELTGAERFACLSADDAEVIGSWDGVPCMIRKQVGKGSIFYCGTNLGEAAEVDPNAFSAFLNCVAEQSGAEKNLLSDMVGLRIDRLSDRLITINNTLPHSVTIPLDGRYRGLFSGVDAADSYTAAPESADLLIRED